MRKLGWYADSAPELVMNLGTWAMIFGLGVVAGDIHAASTGVPIFLIGGGVGIGGQIAWMFRREGGVADSEVSE